MSQPLLSTVQTVAPAEAAPSLEIRLFGPMEVRLGSQPLPRLRSRKGLWLLALLALRAGRDVERRWLAETLWPGDDAAAARHSLRQSLHDLRLALGPEADRLTADGLRTLRLDLSGASIDVLAFDAALARGDLPSLEAAVRLYRGPLLEDCAEDWIQPERRPREQGYVAALEQLAAASTARGEHAEAASTLQVAVGVDPYREELQRALMEALAAAGNPGSALLAYRQFRALLWRELAADPAEETTALFRRLRDESRVRARPPAPSPARSLVRSPAPAPAVAPRRLPLPLTALIGREEEVREVRARLGQSRLVTLTGTGGIGKTRLALQVAEELTDEYADGACLVPLAPLADPERVPDAVRAALGMPPGTAPKEPIEALREYLAPRRLLLVLDNCEHLLDACATLAEALLSQCPELRILATSRQALGLGGETVWRVPSLSLPDPTEGSAVRGQGSGVEAGTANHLSSPPDPRPLTPAPRPLTPDPQPSSLLQSAAVRLFVERARAAEASFAMTPRNAAAIVEVCRRLDGIPLAIELAAARVRALPMQQIAARLKDRFRLLTGGSRGVLPRQQTLRASLDWSYDLLSRPEQALMRRLSVFAGTWTLEAAENVCPDGVDSGQLSVVSEQTSPSALSTVNCQLPTAEILDLLTSLVEKSLVVYEAQEPEGRYGLLETVREYCDARRQEAGEGDALRERHLEYFVALAEEADGNLLKGIRPAEWLDRLEVEHDNLRAALDWSLAEGRRQKADTPHDSQLPSAFCLLPSAAESGFRLAAALGNFWMLRGYFTEGRQRLEHALAGAAGTPAGRAKALYVTANLAYKEADYPAARSYYAGALALRRESGDRLGIAHALRGLGLVAHEQGDYASAHQFYEEVLPIYRDLGNRLGIAHMLVELGRVSYAQEAYEPARSLYEQGLAICRELGDRAGIASALNNLGVVASTQGEYTAARSFYEEALALRRELRDRSGTGGTLNNLGAVALAQGEYGVARSLYRESLALRRESGDFLGATKLLYALAELACAAQLDAGDGEAGGEGGSQAGTAGSAAAESRAARLFGAAEALREAIGAAMLPLEQEQYHRHVSRLREALGEPAFAAAWAEGHALTREHAIAYALEEIDVG